MDNILEILKKYVTTDVVKHLMATLGESETGISRAISTAIPTVFAGLVNCASDNKVMSGIYDLMQETHNTGDALSNISSYVGEQNSNNPFLVLGGKLLGTLFGGRMGSVSEYISSHAGVKKTTATAVLGMVTPMIMGFLGREIKDERLNVAGLGKLLLGQKANVLAGISAGALSSLELNHVGGSKNAGALASGIEDGAKGLNWLFPLAAMLVLGGFLLYNFKSSGNNPPTPANIAAPKPVQTPPPPAQTAPIDTVVKADTSAKTNPMWAHLGNLSARKLANGTSLNLPEKGVENKLLAFIEDKSKAVDKTTWFDFDRLLFDTGKSSLRAESQEQLKNVTEILKAYPNVEIKLGGYTDNQGKEENNVKLSNERATSAMNEIVKMGIAASRVKAEGYGSQFPVADNATPEGREKNRRVSIRVSKK